MTSAGYLLGGLIFIVLSDVHLFSHQVPGTTFQMCKVVRERSVRLF